MAWGYTPYKVKGRRAPPGAPGPGLPKFLLVVLCVCACVFIFAIVSEILGTPERSREKLMIRLDNGADTKKELLVNPESDWEQGEGKIDRKFRVLWKKPVKHEKQVSLWEETEPYKREDAGKTTGGSQSWDQAPEEKKEPGGW